MGGPRRGQDGAGRGRLPDGRPLVGDDHRHRQVHRLRQLRAGLQDRERRPARALLLPHLGRALPRRGVLGASRGRLAERRLRRLPGEVRARRQGEELLRPEALQPLRALAVRPGLPGGRDVREPGRRRPRRQDVLPRLPLLRAGLPVRLPLHRPADEHGRQVHPLLPPDHEGPDDGLLRDLPDGRAAARRPEGPEGPDPRVPEDAQGPGPEAPDGDRRRRSGTPASTGRCGSDRWKKGFSTPSRGSCTRTRSSSSGAS